MRRTTKQQTTPTRVTATSAPAKAERAAMSTLAGLSPQLVDSLVEAVANGVPFETAAAVAGFHSSTIQEWIHAASGTWRNGLPVPQPVIGQAVDLAERIARAQAEFEARQVTGIVKAADQVNEKTGQQDWRARAWLLNNHPRTRATYHEQKEVEVTRPEPFRELEWADSLSDAELEAEYERLPPLVSSATSERGTAVSSAVGQAMPGGLAPAGGGTQRAQYDRKNSESHA